MRIGVDFLCEMGLDTYMTTNPTTQAQAIETHATNFAGWLEGAIANLATQAADKGLTEEQAVAAIKATLLAELKHEPKCAVNVTREDGTCSWCEVTR